MCHKETLVSVPALFLGRAHTERRQMATASEWPTTADLGQAGFQGPDNAARSVYHIPEKSNNRTKKDPIFPCSRFIQSLPDFDQLSPSARQYSLTSGHIKVCLARLLSRYTSIVDV